MRFRRFAPAPSEFLVSALALLFAGCSSSSIVPQVDNAMYRRLVPPPIIHVRPFDTSAGVWEGGASAQTERTKIRNALADSMVARLSEITAAEIYMGIDAPADGWLVTGKFVQVSSPRHANLGPVGVGRGGSKLVTEVTVYDLAESATDPILVFTTTGTSKRLVNVDMQKGADDGNVSDIDRAAQEIRDYLLEKLTTG